MLGTVRWEMVLAIWGAALATFLGVIRLIEFVEERRPHVTVSASEHYVEDHHVIVLYAANNGRRPVTLMAAALELANGRQTPGQPPREWSLPCRLEEGQTCQLLIAANRIKELEEREATRVTGVYFRDQARREYRSEFTPGWHAGQELGQPTVHGKNPPRDSGD